MITRKRPYRSAPARYDLPVVALAASAWQRVLILLPLIVALWAAIGWALTAE